MVCFCLFAVYPVLGAVVYVQRFNKPYAKNPGGDEFRKRKEVTNHHSIPPSRAAVNQRVVRVPWRFRPSAIASKS